MEKTRRGIERCSEWLKFCLNIGWDKNNLDALEKIWWEHHDEKGDLIITNKDGSKTVIDFQNIP